MVVRFFFRRHIIDFAWLHVMKPKRDLLGRVES